MRSAQSNPYTDGIIWIQVGTFPNGRIPLVKVLKRDARCIRNCPAAVTFDNNVPFLARWVGTVLGLGRWRYASTSGRRRLRGRRC
jgi:hypothetical protein